MKKVEATSLASTDNYRLIEAAPPVPGPGEVLVRVASCGVGYVDALVSLGRYQVKPPLPHVPGQEVGGVVESLGPGVTGLSPGDRVMAHVRGGFAEMALAPVDAVTRIPDRMTLAQAAGFKVNYLTVLHGLRERGRLASGDTVLVIGAAGGVGSAAVQVAKLLGARVIAAASTPEKRDFAMQLGADGVIDSAVEGFRDRLRALCHGKGPDLVFDPVCGPLFEPAFRSLNWGGRHLVVGFAGGPIPALPANLPLLKGADLVGVDVRQFMLYQVEQAKACLAELLAWVAEGRLVPPIGKQFRLEEAVPALQYALTGAGLGKTVLNLIDTA